MRHDSRLLPLLTATLAATSCSLIPSDNGGPCEDDGDCGSSGDCEYGVCKGTCPCEDGWECIRKEGFFGESSYCSKSCHTDSDCPGQWHCFGACPAPFDEELLRGGADYVCSTQSALTCRSDRPISGAIFADKDPRTMLRSEPVTFTVKLLHKGRSGGLKYQWVVDINDVDQPVEATGDALTLGPREEFGTLRVAVQITNDAGQDTTLRYVANFY